MRIIDHPGYDSTFPESFDWSKPQSISVVHFAVMLIAEIKKESEMPPECRNRIAGLRHALNVMAANTML